MIGSLSSIPSWAGSVPAWATLVVVLGYITTQWLKNQPVLNKQRIDERLAIKSGYMDRIQRLEEKVEECREQCDKEIKDLNEQIFGLRKQHIQEQISFINAICAVVDAPQLAILKRALEAGQRAVNVEVAKDG